MSKIVLYSTGCPNCEVLKRVLNKNKIAYELNDNVQEIIDEGFRSVPVLKVENEYLDYTDAIKYAKGSV